MPSFDDETQVVRFFIVNMAWLAYLQLTAGMPLPDNEAKREQTWRRNDPEPNCY